MKAAVDATMLLALYVVPAAIAPAAGMLTVYTPGWVKLTTAPLAKVIEALLPSVTINLVPSVITWPLLAGTKSPPVLVMTLPLTCKVPTDSCANAGNSDMAAIRSAAKARRIGVFMALRPCSCGRRPDHLPTDAREL